MDGQFTAEKADRKGHWDRFQSAELLTDFLNSGMSQRAYADFHDVPRSTLQHWQKRYENPGRTGVDPEVHQFLESPAGVTFAHELLTNLLLEFGVNANCGVQRIQRFLAATRLNKYVVSSFGSLLSLLKEMEQKIVSFGEHERQRLGSQMVALKKITVCEDETFHPEPCLVAIEPVSGFILLEEYHKRRDEETWNQALQGALEGLNVEVVQSVSDRAQALINHAKSLEAHHSPDLFHVQQEISKATSLALQSHVNRAEKVVVDAEQVVAQAIVVRDGCEEQCPESVQTFAQEVEQALQDLAEAKAELEVRRERQQQAREACRGVGDDYHPYDLHSGEPCDTENIQQRLTRRFDKLEEIAQHAELSPSAHKQLAKARRVLPAMVATIAMFWKWFYDYLEDLPLSPEQSQSFRDHLVAEAYLSLAAPKAKFAERRKEILDVAKQRGQWARDGPLKSLSTEEFENLKTLAIQIAQLYQRSTSCVEGRNGHLSLWHHSQHQLRPSRLRALTSLGNYYQRRPDGTTAAERFFGAPCGDLVQWLVLRMRMPGRPRVRKQAA